MMTTPANGACGVQSHASSAVWRCPECTGVVRMSDSSLQCTLCGREFQVFESIPVFAHAPRDSTQSLSAREVEALLRRMETVGWPQALRETLRGISDAPLKSAFAEFVNEHTAAIRLIVGKPDDTSVLCLGSTAGAMPLAVSQYVALVEVCDLSLACLRILQRRAVQEGLFNIQLACCGDTRYLPYCDQRFDLVLIGSRALPPSQLGATSMWREVARVLKPGGRCFVDVHTGGRWVRRLLARNSSARSSRLGLSAFQKLANDAGLHCCETYRLWPDSQTPYIVVGSAARTRSRFQHIRQSLSQVVKAICAGNNASVSDFGLVLQKPRLYGRKVVATLNDTLVQKMLSAARNVLEDAEIPNAEMTTRRMHVRNSGRMVVIAGVQGEKNHLLAIKIPWRASAKRNDERNARALRMIHSNATIPEEIRRLIPRHLAAGTIGNQSYFVEDAIQARGVLLPWKRYLPLRRTAIANQNSLRLSIALSFSKVLLLLERATARVVNLRREEFSPITRSLTAIRSVVDDAVQQRTCDAIGAFLERQLLGRELPLVWCHGDAGMGNVVADLNGKLCGIMDWETFDQNGLPLSDWILLRISLASGEGDNMGWPWLRYALQGEEHVFFDCFPVEAYFRAMRLDPELLPALAWSAWARYVAHRLANRGHDPEWRRRVIDRVLQYGTELPDI